MATTNVYDQVLKLLSELSGETDLTPETRLKQDLALDSIEVVQLVLQLNREFGIQIHSSEILPEHFASIAQLTAFITSKQET